MKFRGKVGYILQVETAPGVWTPQTTERTARGDVLVNNRKWEQSDQANADLNITNQISIVADSFSISNFSCLRYIEYAGAKWSIVSAKIDRPRIILTLGGVWNG